VEATTHRFRPILLTAAAAILGMIPIAPTIFWGPMAYAIMGGLAVATVLTLIFLPALLSVQEHVRRVHYEGSINSLPLLDLTCDALEAILAALGVDGRDQGGATAHDGPQERRDRTQKIWIDVHGRLQQMSPCKIRRA